MIVAALASPLRTALIHESLHAQLLPGRLNSFTGRLLAASQVLSWEAVQWGHWTHHRWTRHPLDRPDLADRCIPRWRARGKHLAHLCGGACLFSLGFSLALFLPLPARASRPARRCPPLPAMRNAALELLADNGRVAHARGEVAVGLLWHDVAINMWGLQWPVLAVGWVARAGAVSVLDNVAHHGTKGDLGAPARNLRLRPTWGALLLLHGNLHEVHHHHPELPWTDLPHAHRLSGGHFDGRYVAALLSQFRGLPAPTPA